MGIYILAEVPPDPPVSRKKSNIIIQIGDIIFRPLAILQQNTILLGAYNTTAIRPIVIKNLYNLEQVVMS